MSPTPKLRPRLELFLRPDPGPHPESPSRHQTRPTRIVGRGETKRVRAVALFYLLLVLFADRLCHLFDDSLRLLANVEVEFLAYPRDLLFHAGGMS